jgi:hypothetical protein
VGPGPDPGGAALERAPLILAHTTPDAGILATLYRPVQAGLDDRAAPAHLLGLIYLEQRRTGIAYREEQLRIHVLAGGVVAPVHVVHSSSSPGFTDPAHRSGLVNEFTS